MRLHLQRALLPTGIADDVVVEIEDGRIRSVASDSPPRQGAGSTHDVELRGLTLPGFANTHSHAFHRALRGRTQTGRGSFWTWREQMYAVAQRLDPDSCYAIAHSVYREMLAAGYTAVAEFHYVHHQPDGSPYTPRSAMADAVVAAAADAGIRLTLLLTLYSSSGFGAPVEQAQRRFAHRTADELLQIAEEIKVGPDAVVGLAAHSVRAVAPDQLERLADGAGDRPLHVHLSEQRAENQACLQAHGVTPTRLLADTGFLGPRTTVVHATHLSEEDIAILGEARATVSMCPTTERDLGDGVGPARRLHEAGCPVTIGSDSQAVVDPFEELRAVELDERLAAESRGHWTARELITAGAGTSIEVGSRADLVTVDLASMRTAGTGAAEETAVFAATSADVLHVVAGGVVRFRRGDEQAIADELAEATGRLTS